MSEPLRMIDVDEGDEVVWVRGHGPGTRMETTHVVTKVTAARIHVRGRVFNRNDPYAAGTAHEWGNRSGWAFSYLVLPDPSHKSDYD